MAVASQWVKELKVFSEFQVEFNSFPIELVRYTSMAVVMPRAERPSYVLSSDFSELYIFCFLSFSCEEHRLHPNQCVLYAWDEPSYSKEFVWYIEGSQQKFETDLKKVLL